MPAGEFGDPLARKSATGADPRRNNRARRVVVQRDGAGLSPGYHTMTVAASDHLPRGVKPAPSPRHPAGAAVAAVADVTAHTPFVSIILRQSPLIGDDAGNAAPGWPLIARRHGKRPE